MNIWHIIISLLAGIAAGFLGAVTGGGGILSIPALIFLGLPIDVAIATNRLAAFGIISAAIPQYQKAKKIQWKLALKFTPVAILGGLIGAKALIHINTSVLSLIAGALLLLMIPIVFLYSDRGIKPTSTSPSKKLVGYLIYFLIMIYGGFFGGGTTMLVIYVLLYCFGVTFIEANATAIVPWFFLSVAALIVFLMGGLVNFELGLPMMAGMYVGGTVGAKTALERGNAWVRAVFIAAIAASSIKLIFFR